MKDTLQSSTTTTKGHMLDINGIAPPSSKSQRDSENRLSKSESALNFAFLSFLGFTILQFIFALAARSDAMLADCAGEYCNRTNG